MEASEPSEKREGSPEKALAVTPRTADGAAGIAEQSLSVAFSLGSAALRRPVALARSVGSSAANRALDTGERALSSAIDVALDSPRTKRLLEQALAQPGMQSLIASVIGSQASEAAVDQLLDSEELETLVSEIAESPQVRSALAAQTTGMAAAVGSQVRHRAAAADSLSERIARRLVGRRPRDAEGTPALPEPKSPAEPK